MEDVTNKKSYALYRKEHWFAIKLKNQMYRRLSHVKKRRLGTRSQYLKEYYRKNRQKIIRNVNDWQRANKDKKKLTQKRYKERFKQKERLKRSNRPLRVKRIIEDFLEYCSARYKPDTVRIYATNITRFYNYIERINDKLLIEELDRDLVTKYVSYVNSDEISKLTSHKLDQPEKETRLSALRVFLRFSQRKGYIKKDIRRFVRMPQREPKVLKRVMTTEEMAKFLEMADTTTDIGIRNRALLELSYSGLRADEMLSLKVEHVDLVTNTVMIFDGKGDKDRVVPMTAECIYWIKRWLNKRPLFVKRAKDPGYLFITKKRTPILRDNLAVVINRYAKKAGVPIKITPHDLRRTTATHLVENGAPIRAVQAILGHASLRVTTKYLRLTDEKIRLEHKRSHPSNRRYLHYGKVQR